MVVLNVRVVDVLVEIVVEVKLSTFTLRFQLYYPFLVVKLVLVVLVVV